MNGAADLGGMMGFGPIQRDSEDRHFHGEWERRTFALVLAMGGTRSWNLDESRFVRESMPPAQYLGSSYYEVWLSGLLQLLLQKGLASQQELEDGTPRAKSSKHVKKLTAEMVASALSAGSPVNRPARAPARFEVGNRVVTCNNHPNTHTRLPRYLRGKFGVIQTVHGVHVYPDSNAHGKGEDPRWLYGVRFSSEHLWGEQGHAADSIIADCWEPYLEPA